MSTSSAFGTITDGRFQGRRIHWDGYPTHMGPILAALIDRDGIENVLSVLTGKYHGWVSLYPTLPELTDELAGQLPDLVEDLRNPAHPWTELREGARYGDGSFIGVPGYGIARTPHNGQLGPHGRIEFDVCGPSADTSDIEWAYAVEQAATGTNLVVIKINATADHPVVARAPLSELATIDWGKAECGPEYERCSHYAWAHDPKAQGTSVGMRTWIGAEEPHHFEATHAIVEGSRARLSGSGRSGVDRGTRYWVASTDGGQDIRTGLYLDNGRFQTEVDLVIPTASGELIFASGTVLR